MLLKELWEILDEAPVDFAAKILPFHYKTFFQTFDQTMD